MRLDSFLSSVGIVKRRTEAARLLREGRVLVDDRVAKPAAEVRIGQQIRVDGPKGVTCWKVVAVPEGNVRKTDYPRYATRLEPDAGTP